MRRRERVTAHVEEASNTITSQHVCSVQDIASKSSQRRPEKGVNES